MAKITETSREHIADANFAFPKEKKEPIHDAAHVRNAIARFNQVQGVSEDERDAAWSGFRRRPRSTGWMLRRRAGASCDCCFIGGPGDLGNGGIPGGFVGGGIRDENRNCQIAAIG